jgi:hypothetical protein
MSLTENIYIRIIYSPFEGVAMQSDQDVSGFWCWHKGCPDYGKKSLGNIVLKEGYG